MAEIDAKVGGIGIVPSELHGAIVSSHYFLFEVDEQRCFRTWLDYYIRSGGLEEQIAARGSTNYAAIRPHHVLECEIPLPSVPEQRRIVARIEELSAKIEEALTLRKQSVEEREALGAAVLNTLFTTEMQNAWPLVELGEVADIRSGVTLGRALKGSTIRLPYLRVANVQDSHLDLSMIKEVDILESELDKWQLQSGDVLLTEGGDWDKLGRGTVWRGEIPNCIHQNHIFRVRTKPEDFNPDFLAAVIGSPYGKAYFQSASKQTTNLASINQRQLKAFKIPRPPVPEQRRIVKYLDDLQSKVDTVRAFQEETTEELQAFMPSILSRAFSGTL